MTDVAIKTAYQRLSPLKRRFVELMVGGSTGTAAMRKLKPKSKRPDTVAWKWKNTPLIREAIDQRLAERMEDLGITTHKILLDIADMGNVSVASLVWQEGEKDGVAAGTPKKLHELDDVTARCIQSIDVNSNGAFKVRWVDKLAAKKLLGQYKRLFTESHEINIGEKTIEQLLAGTWNRPRPPADDAPPAAGL